MKQALVIDDQREIVESICKMLSLMDIQGVAAYSPLAALTIVKEHVPDIIFVDIHMPGLEGVEVIHFLRREPAFLDVPIIVITSDDQKETRTKALQAGARQVIIKPVTFETLERVVKSVQ